MEVRSSTGLPDHQTTDFQVTYSFNLSEAKLEDDFMGSAILQRRRGGHTLAMPSWTIVPLLYHTPPKYDTMSRDGGPVDRDDKSETRKLIQEDELGTMWTILSRDRLEHNNAMKLVHEHVSEGLSNMKSVEYFEAVTRFDRALSKLWPCHSNTPLERWIKTHRGHALLRAGLLQCPDIHGEKTSKLLQMSFETLNFECVVPLRDLQNCGTPAAFKFNRSLLFSGLLGLAWISFFRGNMEEAELYINEAETVDVDLEHRRTYLPPKVRSMLRSKSSRQDRPPVDIDTLFFQGALCRVIGSVDDIENCQNKFGSELTNYEEDCSLVGLMDNELLELQGEFETAVLVFVEWAYKPEEVIERYFLGTTEVVANFLDRLQAGYAGNMWFALGASGQAKAAYECALGSGSVLLHAAALVGLGNVFMRLIEGSASIIGNEEIGAQSCTTANKLKLEFVEAEKKYKEALEVYDELGYKEGQIKVQCNLGNLYHKRGQLQEALERYNTAKSYVNEKMDKGLPALHLHLKLSELHLDMKDWKMAYKSIRTALSSQAATNNIWARAWIEHLNGSYYLEKTMAKEDKEERVMKGLSEAQTHLKGAIQCLAEIQMRIGAHTSLWLVIFETQKETYTLLLWCIACTHSYNTSRNNSVVEALVWCERSRSRVSMVDWWDRYIQRVQQYLIGNDVAVRDALTVTSSPNDTLTPYENDWAHLQVLLKRCILPVATVVEYVLCADFGFLIFVLDIPEGEPKMIQVSFKEQKLNGEKLIELVNRTVSLLDPKSIVNGEWEHEAEANLNLASLYKLLIKPVEGWLKNTQQIIVIPHEVLFKVPFHALIDEKKKFLIERYTLSYEESIKSLVMRSLLWELNTHSRQVQDARLDSVPSDQKMKKNWLVVGINKHRPVAPDLHSAEFEAETVDSLLGEVFEFESRRSITEDKAQERLFRGSKEGATKEQVVPHFIEADIIHLATHGIVNAKYERGGILFQAPVDISSGDKVTSIISDFEPSCSDAETFKTTTRLVADYRKIARSYRRMPLSESLRRKVVLSASEISSMELKAQLVVFSACQSANGVIMGEGVAGLGRALLQAGVPCTVLSLWRVLDKVTIDFMREFYMRIAQRRSVADAMQEAMKTMIKAKKKYSEERKYMVGEWAPFLVFGLPNVQVVANTTLSESPKLPKPSVPPGLKSQSILNKLLGKIGVLAVLVSGVKTPALTRGATTEASVLYAWNPLHIKLPHACTKPKSRGLASSSEKKMVIFAILAFHFQTTPS